MVKELPPEIKYARKILIKNHLTIPFDLFDLVSKYAKVMYLNIPVTGVDGIAHNLKTPGKTPRIIVNSSISETRQRFTLAHEFGHLMIPWHLGTIADDVNSSAFKDYIYKVHESEANSFAAEILMPFFWIEELLKSNNELAVIHSQIVQMAKVSPQAAAIRLLNFLPKNCLYFAEEGHIIIHSGCSADSDISRPRDGTDSSSYQYEPIESSSECCYGNTKYHWLKLKNEVSLIRTTDTRTWKEILSTILDDVTTPVLSKSMTQSINGVIACANGKSKRSNAHTPEELKADCVHRLNSRDELKEFCAHKDFELFIDKRISAFFDK